MILDLLYITTILCFVIDISGAVDSLKKFIFHLLKGRKATYIDFSLKPFDCSLCMTWWVGLAYLLLKDSFEIKNIVIVVLFSLFAEILTYLLVTIKDIFGKLINKINK